MRPIVRRTQQLHRLAVFDAVARTGSFTAAANELQISQPAVSRHMQALTKAVGFDLVERSGRSIALTHRGQSLADALDGAFLGVERVLDDIDERSSAFVVAVQPAMATSWVVPLLDQLETAAQTEIRLRIFERPAELASSDWDLAIVPGTGRWEEWESSMLFREIVRPFASRTLAAELALHERSLPTELIDKNLLHIDPVGRPNMTWNEWFTQTGSTPDLPAPRLIYNTYPTVVQEAIAGNGIVLGWQFLLSDLVTRGLLVPVGPVVRRERGGHYLCWQRGQADARHNAIRIVLETEIRDDTSSPTWRSNRQ